MAQISFEPMAIFLPSSLVLGLPLGASTSWSGLSLQVMLADLGQSWAQPMGSTANEDGGQALSAANLARKRGGVLGKHSSVNTLSVS